MGRCDEAANTSARLALVFDRVGVPTRSQRRERQRIDVGVDVGRCCRRSVDGELVGDVRELGEPGHRHASSGDGHVAERPGAIDALLEHAAADHPDDSTRSFEFLHGFPGGARQLVGELFDVPGTAGDVDHLGQVALLDQHQLGVTTHAPAEIAAAGDEQFVVRQDRDRIGATHASTEALDRAAQQVDRHVVSRRRSGGRHRVLALDLRSIAGT